MTAELFTGELEETKKFKNKPTAVFDQEIQKPPSPNGKSPDIGEKVSLAAPTVRSPMDTSPSSSNPKDLVEISKEDQLKYTKAEIDQVKKENEILRTMLAQIIKDYQSLQMHFFYIVQQEEAKETVESTPAPKEVEEPDQLVSLSLGSSSSGHKKQDRNNTSKGKDVEKNEEGLTLRLECKYDGCSSSLQGSKMRPENIFEEPKEEEEEHGNPWPPRKMLKNLRNDDDEVLQQLQVEKARVCMRTRCNAPTMNDGCLWRKYGLKIAKANPYPRAYYRCTVAPGCPVRKQVQRCAEDRSILITAYEGTHNHSLPVSATAMASTTSAAACMLLSSSSTSQPTTISPASLTTIANANLHGLTFGLSDISRQRQLYLPNPSVSSNTSRPTVTLDLTAPRSSTSQANQFNWLSSSFNTAPRYSSTSLNSSSSDYSNTMPTTWRSGNLSYGSSNKNSSTVSLNLGRQLSLESFCQSYLQKATNLNSSTANEHGVTKGIEMDPSFQSSLAAAVSSLSTSTRFLHAPQR